MARLLCDFGCGRWLLSESLRAFLCDSESNVSLLDAFLFFCWFCLRWSRSFPRSSWRRATRWKKASVSFLLRRMVATQGLPSPLDAEGDGDGERFRRRVLVLAGDGDGEPVEAAR